MSPNHPVGYPMEYSRAGYLPTAPLWWTAPGDQVYQQRLLGPAGVTATDRLPHTQHTANQNPHHTMCMYIQWVEAIQYICDVRLNDGAADWHRNTLKFGWIQVYMHYNDVIMSLMVSQITSLTIVCSTVYPRVDQRKHKSPASLAFVWGIHRCPVNSPHEWPVTRKMFTFDDVIMCQIILDISKSFCINKWKNFHRGKDW